MWASRIALRRQGDLVDKQVGPPVHVHLGSVAGVAVQNHVESLVIEGGRFIF